VDPYSDKQLIEAATRASLDADVRILQAYRLHREEREHVRRLLTLANLPANATVLDVGSGVGEFGKLAEEIRPDLGVIHMNVSQFQLEISPPWQARVCARAEQISLRDGSVDVVMLAYTLGHCPFLRTLLEIKRVLTPGGVLIVYDVTIPENIESNPLDQFGYRVMRTKDLLTALGIVFHLDRWEVPSPVYTDHMNRMMEGDEFARTFGSCWPFFARCIKRTARVSD
jgi:ubiquinone/menaquinone biosynthesis C-methylase UbiE